MADKIFYCIQCNAETKTKGLCVECKMAEKARRKARDKKRRY